jgi:hypothetical protein
MKLFGPFTILEKIGQSAYILQLLERSLIHQVFHASQLKEHVHAHTHVYKSLPEPLTLDSDNLIPEEVMDRHLVKKGNSALV